MQHKNSILFCHIVNFIHKQPTRLGTKLKLFTRNSDCKWLVPVFQRTLPLLLLVSHIHMSLAILKPIDFINLICRCFFRQSSWTKRKVQLIFWLQTCHYSLTNYDNYQQGKPSLVIQEGPEQWLKQDIFNFTAECNMIPDNNINAPVMLKMHLNPPHSWY